MSSWTYINGVLTVEPLGRTQHEKRYILETILEHLPQVTGSEEDMHTYVLQKCGHNMSSGADEFGETTNNLVDSYGNKSRSRGWMRTQSEYLIIVEGAFRDRELPRTIREFAKWICRLSKRVLVKSVLVNIEGWDKTITINEGGYEHPYRQMFEWPSWSEVNKTNEPTWAEYLMWDRAKDSYYPMWLEYKYYNNDDNDAEIERRRAYYNG